MKAIIIRRGDKFPATLVSLLPFNYAYIAKASEPMAEIIRKSFSTSISVKTTVSGLENWVESIRKATAGRGEFYYSSPEQLQGVEEKYSKIQKAIVNMTNDDDINEEYRVMIPIRSFKSVNSNTKYDRNSTPKPMNYTMVGEYLAMLTYLYCCRNKDITVWKKGKSIGSLAASLVTLEGEKDFFTNIQELMSLDSALEAKSFTEMIGKLITKEKTNV